MARQQRGASMEPRESGGQPPMMKHRHHDAQPEQEFEAFLRYLKQSRGFDFSVYQRPRLRQRLEKRLQALHFERIPAYWHYLEAEPDEFTWLLNELLIRPRSRDRPLGLHEPPEK